jgi:hypothetical protein
MTENIVKCKRISVKILNYKKYFINLEKKSNLLDIIIKLLLKYKKGVLGVSVVWFDSRLHTIFSNYLYTFNLFNYQVSLY